MSYLITGTRGEDGLTGRLVLVNTQTNTSVVLDGLKERTIDPRPPLKHSNGNLFLQGNPLREVDLNAGTITNRGSMVSRDNYTLREGPDGLIWMGGAPQLRLASYDPITHVITDRGNPWSGYGQEYAEGYVYTLEVDSTGNYVYCGLGKYYWRLAVYDVINDTWLYPFGGDGATVAGSLPAGATDETASDVARDASLNCYYFRNDSNQWYSLSGATATPVSTPTTQSEETINNVKMTVSTFDLDTDWSKVYPGSNGITTTRYRPTGSSDPYTEVQSTVPVYDVPLRRVYPLSSGQILLIPEAYYPLATLNPSTNTVTVLAPNGASNYGVIEVNSKVYLSGYANSFHEYDPQQAWTLDKIKQGTGSSSTNPAHYGGFAKYNRLMDTLNGKVYLGSQWERDDTGSVVGEFDPATKVKRSLRTGLESWDVHGFCASGGKLVHSIEHMSETSDAKLWIVDPTTLAMEREIIPLAGQKAGAHIVDVGNGEVVGASKEKAYRVRVSDGQVLWSATLPGIHGSLRPHYDVNLARGTDGNIYLWIGSRLWRLNPTTGTATKTGLVTTSQGWLSFASNGDLWIAGSTRARRVASATLYNN